MDRRKVLLVVAALIAALGTLLVFLYVRGADTRADAQYGAVTVLRATKQIAPGETVAAAQAAGKFAQSNVVQKDLLPGALTSLDAVTDQVATTAIYPGEQIIATKFGTTAAATGLNIPKGRMAISVNLSDPARVAGFVNPGDKVGVFMSGTQKTQPFVRILLSNVEVIGVGATTVVSTTKTAADGAQTTDQLPKTLLTLALTQDEAEKVLFASQNGELAVGLLTPDSQVAASKGVTMADLFR